MDPTSIGIGVSFTPYERADSKPSIYIVVDVIRASSTIIKLFEKNCQRIFLTDNAQNFCNTRDISMKNFKVCAEDAVGRKMECADFSPSLGEIEKNPEIDGSHVIIQTSNGTAAIHLLARQGASTILIGSMLNAKAIMEKAVELAVKNCQNISIVCAGRNGGTWATIDDVYCAAKLVEYAKEQAKERSIELIIFDSAKIAMAQLPLYTDTIQAFHASASAENLRKIKSTEDIELCAEDSISDITPIVATKSEFPYIEIINTTNSFKKGEIY